MKKILLFLTALISCIGFAKAEHVTIDFSDNTHLTFKAEYYSTSLGVCRPDGLWPCAGRNPTKEEWVIGDCSILSTSADESREDYDKLVQKIEGSGHSAAINDYQKGDKWQTIYLSTEYVEHIEHYYW